MVRLSLFCLLLIGFQTNLFASRVDTVNIYSSAMHKSARAVVMVPEAAAPANGWPVLYLLHGYSGSFSNWILKVPQVKQWADEYQMIIVCPDGDFSSWYVDSPVDSSMRYATYIGEEVPNYIDKHYATRKDKKGRGITGLSMGGFGGLYLGITFRDRFVACGSMSGGVDLNCCYTRFDVSKRIGDTTNYAGNWDKYSIFSIAETLKPEEAPAMIIDCGTSDIFFAINSELHQKLLSLKIPHDYIERPGGHNWPYWANALQYQLLFFKKQFYPEGI